MTLSKFAKIPSRIDVDWRIYALLWLTALPLIIFSLTWFKSIYGIPALLSISILLLHYKPSIHLMRVRQELLLLLISLLLVMYSGNGELNYQTYDHFKHNLIFADLVKYDWPVYYNNSDEHLNYYLGYYLVPALSGKLLGIKTVAITNMLFLTALLYLCLSYLKNYDEWNIWQIALFFFYGASAIFILLFKIWLIPFIEINELFDNIYHIWDGDWGRLPQIPIYESLKWVPQHFMAALIFFVFWHASKRSSRYLSLHIVGILFFWSIYVFVGILLFMAFYTKEIPQKWGIMIKALLPVILLLLFLVIFYLSHFPEAPNRGNFNFTQMKSYTFVISSILSFSFPLLLMHLLLKRHITKAVFRSFLLYFIGSFLFALSGDFDLFARGSLIFQINIIAATVTPLVSLLKAYSSRHSYFIIAGISVLLILPGFPAMTGASIYSFIVKGQWPEPKFHIEEAYNNYNSIKEVMCAINDVQLDSISYNCDPSYLSHKYTGRECILLRER